MTDERPRVETVETDRTHGSAWLARQALAVLATEARLAREGADPADGNRPSNDLAGVAAVARNLLAARPSMPVVANRVNRMMATALADGGGAGEITERPADENSLAAVERAAEAGIERAREADDAAAAELAARLPGSVATLSRSGTVREALRCAAPERVLVAESRPGREGVGVAESLAEDSAGAAADGTDVTLTTDAAFPAELAARGVGALVVGADRICSDGRVVNKVGTRAAALAAPADCDCYAVAATDKVARDDTIESEERDPAEVYDGPAVLSVANPTFDVTPAGALTVVTERGVLDPEAIADIEQAHRERAHWSV